MSSEYYSTMGHAIAHISCELPDGGVYDKWASFSGQNFQKVNADMTFKEKLGLGQLFSEYIDGHIISGEENQRRLANYKNAKGAKPKYLLFPIDSAACVRLKDMVTFFEHFNFPPSFTLEDLNKRGDKENLFFTVAIDPYDSYVARQNDPEAKVGGGCTSFGAALIKMAGKDDPAFAQLWQRRVDVSERLIGGTIDPRTGKTRKVDILSLITPDPIIGHLGNHWVYEGYPNRTVTMYDPQKVWDFADSACKSLVGGTSQTPSDWLSAHKDVTAGPVETFTDPDTGDSNVIDGIIIP
jgi:hypothetical protein